MKVCYIYQDQYPWDIRADKITASLAGSGIETHILSRNRTGAARIEQAGERLYYRRLPAGWGPLTRSLLNFPAFFSPVWIRETVELARRENIDLLIVRDLPLGPMAYWAGRISGCKVMMDMAENYPAMIQDTWTYRGPALADYLLRNPALLRAMERWLFPKLDGFLVVSEASRQRIRGLARTETPIWIVGNTPRLEVARELLPHPIAERIRGRGALTLVYVGGLEETRGLEVVIHALARVKEKLKDVLFVIVGRGTSEPRLRALANEEKVEDHVLFGGWVDQKAVPAIIAASDICVVPHYVTEHTDTTIPNKIYDYMAQKKPVIVSNSKSLRDIVVAASCGRSYQDKDPDALAQAILSLSDPQLREQLGRNGYGAVQSRFNWAQDEKILLEAVSSFNHQSAQ
jgi:glycosyltransferase involved in cell wall biosynthesis